MGALLLLRHDRPGGALHGQSAAAAGPCREHRGLPRVSRGAGTRVRTDVDASARVADLRALQRLRVFHAGPGRLDRRSLRRPAQRCRSGRGADERRPPGHGVRPELPPRPGATSPRQRTPEGQHLRAGGRAVLRRRRSQSCAGLYGLLDGDQRRRGVRADRLWTAGATLRLAHGVRRGRAVHPDRPGDLSGRLSAFTGARGALEQREPRAHLR